MGWWQVSADTLAGSRFVVSPLAEATASLFSLERRTATHPGERAWLEARLPAYRERLAADPGLAELVRAARGERTRWIADFLTPTPTGESEPPSGDGTSFFRAELARVREIPDATARAHLEVSFGGPLPAVLLRPGIADRVADLLEWVWTRAVLPRWPRIRTVIEADVIARTAQLGQGGWAEALNGMRPGMRWLGESRLQINTHDYPPRELSGARLLFVPVTPRQGWVSWGTAERYAVVYPCSGVLADADRAAAVPEPLGRLLGPARAGVLMLLATPKSTSQLVTLTGQGLGSVGRHLRVLLDAGLVRRRRTGRSVLYFRTAAGEVLLDAQRDG